MGHLDPLGRRFRIMKEWGEDIRMVFGLRFPDNKRTDWHVGEHDLFDGIGLVRRTFGSYGIELVEWRQRFLPPSLAQRLALVILILKRMFGPEKKGLPWKTRNMAVKGAGPGIASFCFDRPETRRIVEAAGRLGCGLTAFLVHHLDRSVSPALLRGGVPRSWMIPVNLRTKADPIESIGNRSGAFDLMVESADDPKILNTRIKQALSRKEQWIPWYVAAVMALLGKRIQMKALDRFQWHGFGIFSNLGRFSVPDGDGNRFSSVDFLCAPPPSVFSPVGAGAIILNERLGLSLRIHPCLEVSPAGHRELLDNWVSSMISPTGPAVPLPEVNFVAWDEIEKRAILHLG